MLAEGGEIEEMGETRQELIDSYFLLIVCWKILRKGRNSQERD